MFNRNEIGDSTVSPLAQRHAWWELEEFRPDGGMWSIPANTMRKFYADRAAELMADPDRFAAAMRAALREWPRSAETAFATTGLNLRAWVGHAGCFTATRSPEETTRIGWHQLDSGEQYAANGAADTVISEWRKTHLRDTGQEMLWDSDYA